CSLSSSFRTAIRMTSQLLPECPGCHPCTYSTHSSSSGSRFSGRCGHAATSRRLPASRDAERLSLAGLRARTLDPGAAAVPRCGVHRQLRPPAGTAAGANQKAMEAALTRLNPTGARHRRGRWFCSPALADDVQTVLTKHARVHVTNCWTAD